jgi:hypothetical protein
VLSYVQLAGYDPAADETEQLMVGDPYVKDLLARLAQLIGYPTVTVLLPICRGFPSSILTVRVELVC